MSKLTAAKAWAQRGFRVFPLRENAKEPALSDWINLATTDEVALQRMWTDPVLGTEKDYNIGCLCTDMVVMDIDVKKGKDGVNEYAQIGGSYDTLVVQTPTGGFHCYFHGPDSSNSSVSSGVDVRSHNGFVVAPGSTINGIGYTVVTDNPVRWVPTDVERHLTEVKVRQEASHDFEVDSTGSVEAARSYLETCPPAIEGMGGDELTFKTAARVVREFGISIQVAFALMRDYYNPRCEPPWALTDLLQKVENAHDYGTAMEGKLSPEVMFAQIDGLVKPPPSVFANAELSFGNASDPVTIPPRPWVLPGILMKRSITMLLAPGSVGKSSISINLAAHLGLGLDFMGIKPKAKCKTIIYNAEDDRDEQSRRLSAMCQHHDLDYNEVKSNIMIMSATDVKLNLVKMEFNQPILNDVVINNLINQCSDPEIGLLVLDPLVKVHQVDEGNNVAMDAVMETLQYIAREADISILVLHHVSKGGGGKERAGNMDTSRGASSMVNAARVALTLFGPTDEDAEEHGFKEDDRNRWVRLDDAKTNMTLARSTPTWFKKAGIQIKSGDFVGVLKHEEVAKTHEQLSTRIAKLLIIQLSVTGFGSMTIKQATDLVRAEEPIWGRKTDIQARQSLSSMFQHGMDVCTGGEISTITYDRCLDEKTGKESPKITMT